MKYHLLILSFVIGLATTQHSQSALVINMVESGSDVVATLSGSIDSWSGATFYSTGNAGMFNGIRASGPTTWFGLSSFSGSTTRPIYYYSAPVYPTSFGVGTTLYQATPTSVSTFMGFRNIGDQTIYVDQTYVLGTPVTGTLTWANKSFATLGVTEGSYIWSWTGDSVTLNIGNVSPSPVPEPGQVAASLLALGGIAGYLVIKRRKANRPRCQNF